MTIKYMKMYSTVDIREQQIKNQAKYLSEFLNIKKRQELINVAEAAQQLKLP